MNETVESIKSQADYQIRFVLLQQLNQCTQAQQIVFKRMYANGNLELSLNEVVHSMPEEKLDWAMSQVERTIKKNSIAAPKERPA